MTRRRPPRRRNRTRRVHARRAMIALLCGLAATGLLACGGSGGKLIPVADAGPLQSDFEAIVQAAQSANGNCGATEAAILKAEQDFDALPATVDAGLRNTLRQGIENLRSRSLALCAQPLAQTATTPTTPKTATTDTTTTTTPTTTTPTTATPTTTTPTTPSTPGSGGGTAAPEPGETPPGGGTGVGEGAGGAAEPGAGGQEAGK